MTFPDAKMRYRDHIGKGGPATKSYRRAKNVVWAEDSCSEGNPHVVIGKEVYFRGPDGMLMPVK
jgi:hypothetical protein